MATLVSKATGNFTDAATWNSVQTVANAEVDSTESSTNISTSNSDSSQSTLAAQEIDAIGLKISHLIGNAGVAPTGTITVVLRNVTTSADSRTVTINASDIPFNVSGGYRGWCVFKFSSPITPNGTDSYLIRVTRSVADSTTNRVALVCTTASTPSTMSRFYRRTATAAPAADDKLIIAGEFTGAGTSNSFTVTLNESKPTGFLKSRGFNGSNMYFTKTHRVDQQMGSTNFSIAAWAYIGTKQTGDIITKGTVTTSTLAYELHFNNTTDRFQFRVTNNGVTATTATANTLGSPSTGTWYFIVCWWDGANINICVNDGGVDSTAWSSSIFASTAALRIGVDAFPASYWNGRLGPIGIWKKAISAGEITSLYNSGNGKLHSDLDSTEKTSLYAYWDMNQRDKRDFERDFGEGHNNMTPTNTPTVTDGKATATSYGPTVSGGPPQGITINAKGILQADSTTSVHRYLRWKGVMAVFAGGQLLLDNATATTGTITNVTGGTGTTGRIWDATNASPISCYSPSHGLSTGDKIVIEGVYGNTAANGFFTITNVDTNNFTLDSSTGNGAYSYPDMPTGIWYKPLVVTDTTHGLVDDDVIVIEGVVGKWEANGAWKIKKIDNDAFYLLGSLGTTGTYSSGGTWTKRTKIPDSSQITLDMNNVANGNCQIQIYPGATVCGIGKSRSRRQLIAESTVIGSDTNSANSLVDTSTTAVTWKEGAKFDTNWASDNTKIFEINGTEYTISAVGSTTSITATGSIGTNTGASFVYTGSSATRTLKVEDTTGWAAEDLLALTPMGRLGDCEYAIVKSVDSSTQVTVYQTMRGYHSGLNDVNGNCRSEALNLTSNINIILGDDNDLSGYIQIVFNPGFSSNVFLGIYLQDIEVHTGALASASQFYDANGVGCVGMHLNSCSFHHQGASGQPNIVLRANAGYKLLENCVVANPSTNVVKGGGLHITATTTGTWKINNCSLINGGGSSTTPAPFSTNDTGGILTNNRLSGGQDAGYSCMTFSEGGGLLGYIYNNRCYGTRASAAFRFTMSRGAAGVFKDTYAMRCNNSSDIVNTAYFNIQGKIIVDGLTMIGCNGTAISLYLASDMTFFNTNVQAGANLTGAVAIITYNSYAVFYEAALGNITNLTTAIYGITGAGSGNYGNTSQTTFDNCLFGGTMFTTSFNSDSQKYNMVVSLNHNQVAGSHIAWLGHGYMNGAGNIATDTTIYKDSSPSIKLTPNAAFPSTPANNSLFFARMFSPTLSVPVASGQTITPTVWVRKSASGDGAAYNGREPRLILRACSYLGYDSDTVLDTVSVGTGTWEQLTGSVTAASDGVFQFYIDYDGTTGWINVDDFVCNNAARTGNTKYWGADFFGPAIVASPNTTKAARNLSFSGVDIG